MSFRLRVFLLVMLVAVTAIGATAWLSVRLVSRQLQGAETAAGRQNADLVVDPVAKYGRDHGTWEGVSTVVYDRFRADPQHQRIRLTTLDNQVIVDTEALDHRAARPVVSGATLIDPRPELQLGAAWHSHADDDRVHRLTLDAIARYRRTARLAACLTRSDDSPVVREGPLGVPDLVGDSPKICGGIVPTTADEDTTDRVAVSRCPPQVEDQVTCLERAFTDRIAEFSPVPLKLNLGALDIPTLNSVRGPVAIAAGGVVVLALLGTALVARRLSRPIQALTAASAGLAGGDFDTRVPLGGTDELGRLLHSFNRMATSIQGAEQRQRQLLADVAHELRTPLANLRGYLEALRDGVFEPSHEVFASLHEEAVLQQRIVDDLQDLALAEAGIMMYQKDVFDLVELVEVSGRAGQSAAELVGVRLIVEPSGPLLVNADADRLRQVIGNLLSNAIRHTPADGTITLCTRAVDGEGVVEVADSGCGISADDLPHVFERFWRADAARGRTTGGSGLGLTISRQIVIDLGGRIDASSQLGIGTTLTVTLPLVEG